MPEITTLTELLSTCLIIIVLYHLTKIHFKYRKYAKTIDLIPGPPTIPIFGNGWGFINDKKGFVNGLNTFCQIYGTPFRLWFGMKPIIFVAEPEDVQLVLGTYSAVDRGEDVSLVFKPVTGDGLFVTNPKKWKYHRKVISPSFSKPVLDTFMPVFVKASNNLVKCLEEHVDKDVFNIWEYLCRASLDIICGTTMGIESNCQIQRNEYTEAAKTLMEITSERFLKIWLRPDIVFYATAYGRKFKTCRKITHRFGKNVNGIFISKKQFKRKEEETNDDNDNEFNEHRQKKAFLDYFMELHETDPNFTLEDLLAEIDTMIFAGFETTALTNAFLLLILAQHQNVQEKVYDEIYNIFGDSDRDITLEDLNRLHYLELVIKEVLRMFPIVHLIFRKPEKDYQLTKCTVPAGCTISILVKHVHMNPKIWWHPEKFDPLRFTVEESTKRPAYSYIPFGAGPRNCIGGKFAFMSIKTQISTLLRKYRVTTDVRADEVELISTVTLRSSIGYPVRLHRR